MLYTCAGPSCATPPTCPSEAAAARLTLAAMWAAWEPATAPAQVRLKAQPTWPPGGAFAQAPEAILTACAFCIFSGACWVRQCGALVCPGDLERQTEELSAMWIMGDVLCRHHWHRHHWHNWHRHDWNPHRHNRSPHGHRRDHHRPDCHRRRQCSPDCVMIPHALSAHADRCPLQATLAACDLCTTPACAGSSPQQVVARPCAFHTGWEAAWHC